MSGVTRYLKANVTVTVNVWEHLPVCSTCRWLKYEHDLRRYTCLITDEPMLEVNKDVGRLCPLRGKEDKT